METTRRTRQALENQNRIYFVNIDQIEQLKAEGKRRTAITLAACALGCRKRGCKERQCQPRIWTGYLEGRRRAFRGQPVILANGTLGFIYGILRGKAAIWKESPFVVGEREHMVVDVSDIQPYKLPSAVLLGSQKRGTKELPSPRKQEACRKNGCRPCHPGRARGRPKKAIIAITAKPQAGLPVSPPAISTPRTFNQWVEYYSRPANRPQITASGH